MLAAMLRDVVGDRPSESSNYQLAVLLLALERRLIAFPKAQDKAL